MLKLKTIRGGAGWNIFWPVTLLLLWIVESGTFMHGRTVHEVCLRMSGYADVECGAVRFVGVKTLLSAITRKWGWSLGRGCWGLSWTSWTRSGWPWWTSWTAGGWSWSTTAWNIFGPVTTLSAGVVDGHNVSGGWAVLKVCVWMSGNAIVEAETGFWIWVQTFWSAVAVKWLWWWSSCWCLGCGGWWWLNAAGSLRPVADQQNRVEEETLRAWG